MVTQIYNTNPESKQINTIMLLQSAEKYLSLVQLC
jgi:hypothetical protein